MSRAKTTHLEASQQVYELNGSIHGFKLSVVLPKKGAKQNLKKIDEAFNTMIGVVYRYKALIAKMEDDGTLKPVDLAIVEAKKEAIEDAQIVDDCCPQSDNPPGFYD